MFDDYPIMPPVPEYECQYPEHFEIGKHLTYDGEKVKLVKYGEAGRHAWFCEDCIESMNDNEDIISIGETASDAWIKMIQKFA